MRGRGVAVVEQRGHNYAVDWWSLGVLAFEMLHGEAPFEEDDFIDSCDRIVVAMYWADAALSAAARDLLGKLLVVSPATRLGMLATGAQGVHGHPFCAHINVQAMLARELQPPPPFVPPALEAPTSVATADVACDEAAETGEGAKEGDAGASELRYAALWKREFGPMV